METRSDILPSNRAYIAGGVSEPPEVGFFAALFDYSFSQFITVRLVRLLYVIATGIGVIAALLTILFTFIGAAFVPSSYQAGGGGRFLIALILVPLAFLIYMIVVRLYLELVVVLFRIAEYAREIAHNTGNR